MKTPKKILNDPRRPTDELMAGLLLGYAGKAGEVGGRGAAFQERWPCWWAAEAGMSRSSADFSV